MAPITAPNVIPVSHSRREKSLLVTIYRQIECSDIHGIRAAYLISINLALSEFELRDLQQLAVFHCRLVRDDSGDGHVKCLCNINERFAILENCGDKFVAQITVRTAMAAGRQTWWEARTFCGGKLHVDALADELIEEGTLLTPNTSHFAAVTRRIPTHAHPRHSAFAGAEERDFGAEGIFVTVFVRLQIIKMAVHALTGNLSEAAAGDAYIICIGVRRIKLRRQADAPAFIGIDRLGHPVEVFPFGIDNLAKAARLINLTHGIEVFVEARCLEHHIFKATLFNGVEKFVGVFYRTENCWNGASDVFAVLERFHDMAEMARRIGRDEDCFDGVVFDEFFEGWIRFCAATFFSKSGTTIRNQVADGHNFYVRMVLESKGRTELANSIADDADADFTIGNRVPTFVGGGRIFGAFEALNGVISGGCR